MDKELLGSIEVNRIYQMNCFDGVELLPDESVDLIVTSPPYAMQRKKSYGGISEDEYPEWITQILKQCMSKLKKTGSLILNIKEHVNKGEKSLYVYKSIIKLAEEFRFVEEFIWNKTNPFPTGNKKRLKDGYERCYHFVNSNDYKFYPNNVLVESTSKWLQSEKKRKNKGEFSTNNGSGMNMGQRIASDLVRPSNVLTIPSSCINIGHPAVFPLELPEFFIKLMTDEHDVILDPFMGSGTTAIAAKKNKRKYIGFETEHKYIEISNLRLESLYNEAADKFLINKL